MLGVIHPSQWLRNVPKAVTLAHTNTHAHQTESEERLWDKNSGKKFDFFLSDTIIFSYAIKHFFDNLENY